MRALVTGASGFAGRHLVRKLADRGDEVIAVLRPGHERPRELVGLPKLTWLPLELTDPAATMELLTAAQPEVIFHLAADSSPAASLRQPVNCLTNNIGSTAAVLYAAVETVPQPRVLLVTSSEIYGLVDSPEPLAESQPPAPTTPYGFSKLACSLLGRHLVEVVGLEVIEARPFNHIGPGQQRGFVVPDFASQVAAIALGNAPPVLRVGDLAARKDYTDVRDIVDGYVRLAELGTPGETYHLCSGRDTSAGELLSLLVELAGIEAEVQATPSQRRTGPPPRIVGSYQKAHEATGWVPWIPLHRTLDEVLAEWRERMVSGQIAPG